MRHQGTSAPTSAALAAAEAQPDGHLAVVASDREQLAGFVAALRADPAAPWPDQDVLGFLLEGDFSVVRKGVGPWAVVRNDDAAWLRAKPTPAGWTIHAGAVDALADAGAVRLSPLGGAR